MAKYDGKTISSRESHRPVLHLPELLPMDLFIARQLSRVSALVILTFLIAGLFYKDGFLFWKHALSELGGSATRSGEANAVSRVIVTTGFILMAFIMGKVGFHYHSHPAILHNLLKSKLALISSVGFFVFNMPHDRFKWVHVTGSVMMIAGIFLISTITLAEMRGLLPGWRHRFYQILLSGTVIPYAVGFLLNVGFKQVLQKFCIAGLSFVLTQISGMGAKLSGETMDINQSK